MKCQSIGTNFQALTMLSSVVEVSGQTQSQSFTPSTCIQTVFDEMMVEQTDLVRLRLVRMSNVPDTLYMVNNAVPQCCHMISHQQMASTSAAVPSVVANEIPGETVVNRHPMTMKTRRPMTHTSFPSPSSLSAPADGGEGHDPQVAGAPAHGAGPEGVRPELRRRSHRQL